MAYMNDFASLLQLGFGIGAGLSLFRAPMDLRAAGIQRRIGSEIEVLERVKSPGASAKVGLLSSLEMRFHENKSELDGSLKPIMAMTFIVALVNVSALVWVSLDPRSEVSLYLSWGFIFISVGYYLVVGLAVEWLTRKHLGRIRSALDLLDRGKSIDHLL